MISPAIRLLLLLLRLAGTGAAETGLVVTEFGAPANGKELATHAIQAETALAREAGIGLTRAYLVGPHVSLIGFDGCRNIRLTGVTLRHSPHWAVHLADCEDIEITGLTIESSLTAGMLVWESANIR
ncbi:MAG: hypothetical protein MUF04_11380, partial [Akkermansiaceae bacterium]|nr:hypothetical protein [Akkermansiaceae bacterium]